MECECCGKSIGYTTEFNNFLFTLCEDCIKETSESRKIINNCEKMIKLLKNKIENEYEEICGENELV